MGESVRVSAPLRWVWQSAPFYNADGWPNAVDFPILRVAVHPYGSHFFFEWGWTSSAVVGMGNQVGSHPARQATPDRLCATFAQAMQAAIAELKLVPWEMFTRPWVDDWCAALPTVAPDVSVDCEDAKGIAQSV